MSLTPALNFATYLEKARHDWKPKAALCSGSGQLKGLQFSWVFTAARSEISPDVLKQEMYFSSTACCRAAHVGNESLRRGIRSLGMKIARARTRAM